MQNKKVLILGGGLAGLSAADKLLENNFKVTILEKSNLLGGLASSFTKENQEIPRFNHHIVKKNKITLSYLKRYNLLTDNKWQKIKMSIGIEGKLSNINTPLNLLKFKYLSPAGRLRLGLFGAYLIFLLNPKKIPDTLDAETWLKKYAGKEGTEKIWHQLYAKNKFNILLKEISAKQFAHRLHEKEGYDKFTYPKKGLQKMINGLEKDILSKGCDIKKEIKITKLDLNLKKIDFIEKKKKITSKFDIIINTIPIPELLKFTNGLPKSYITKIKKLRYVPVVGICFGTKDFLDKENYWINFIGEKIHVVYQHSLLLDKYESKVSWCIRYGQSEEDMKLSKKEIEKRFLNRLKKYFPNMQVTWCHAFTEKYAEPIYDKEYPKYAPTYITPIPYFFNSGIQVTFPKIRNMDVALESGIKVSEIIKEIKENK